MKAQAPASEQPHSSVSAGAPAGLRTRSDSSSTPCSIKWEAANLPQLLTIKMWSQAHKPPETGALSLRPTSSPSREMGGSLTRRGPTVPGWRPHRGQCCPDSWFWECWAGVLQPWDPAGRRDRHWAQAVLWGTSPPPPLDLVWDGRVQVGKRASGWALPEPAPELPQPGVSSLSQRDGVTHM